MSEEIDVDTQTEEEFIVVKGDPGLIDGAVEYWNGQAPETILDGARDFSVDAEAHESYNHDPDASDSEIDRALNALAWYLFSHGVRGEQRDVREERNRVREGAAVSPKEGSAPERPDDES